MAQGRILSDDQKKCANRYDEVIAKLNVTTKVIQKASNKIAVETEEEEEQEQDGKKQQEFNKLKELFGIQV